MIRSVFLTLAFGTLFSAPVQAQMLLPHEANYVVALTKAKPSSGVASIKGVLNYKLEHSCEGWTADYTMKLNYHFLNAPSVNITNNLTSFEKFDETQYDFSLSHKSGSATLSSHKGTASKDKNMFSTSYATENDQNTVSYKDLGDIYFPMAHTKEVIRRALNGERFFTLNLYDGSEPENVKVVSTLIGTQNTSKKTNTYNINSQTNWKTHFAYFKSNEEETPELEMKGIMHDNGVLETIEINYPEFTLIQNLESLKPLKRESC